MMNAVIEAMLRYNRTVLTLLIALFGAGVYSWFILPKEAFPNVTFPSIYVSVYQNGISPEDAEDRLIKPLEGELAGVDGLKTMTSTASQGYANIVLEFEAGFDDEKAEDLGSDIYHLKEMGVPVRTDKDPDHMHHKYALFDRRRLLTGSYNWTRSAALRNEENFIVTNEVKLVDRFGVHFDRLWGKY